MSLEHAVFAAVALTPSPLSCQVYDGLLLDGKLSDCELALHSLPWGVVAKGQEENHTHTLHPVTVKALCFE